MGEAIFFGALFLLGSVSLAGVTASQIVDPTPEIYTPGFGFWLMVLVLASFVLIGGPPGGTNLRHVAAALAKKNGNSALGDSDVTALTALLDKHRYAGAEGAFGYDIDAALAELQ